MRDLFEKQMPGFLYNPSFLAGLAMIRGASPEDAWAQAALKTNEFETALNQGEELKRKQYLDQILPGIIRNLDLTNPQEALSMLVENGIPPQDAALIMERLRVANQSLNPVNSMQPEMPPLTAGERRVNATQIKELDNAARNAERELRLLEDSEGAFKKFDENAGGWSGSGSAVNKIAGYLPKFSENILYNPEAQTAKQEIDKLNSQLYQNRVQGLGARATDAAKEQIAKGLPTTELTPEARRDVITTKKRENYEVILRSKFFSEWARAHGRDLNGAEAAFDSFISSNQILDNQGNINKNLVKLIPQYIAEVDNFSDENINDSGDMLLEEFGDVPLEVLLELRQRQR